MKLKRIFKLTSLFEIDENLDFMPIGVIPGQFDLDSNNDIMPNEILEIEDEEFELDGNFDIMPTQLK